MGERVLVTAGEQEFFAEVEDSGGVATIGLEEVLSFDGVVETVEAIAERMAAAWERVKPAEATVAFGLKLTAKSGKLTGLLVEGGGEAALTITLKWTP